MENCRDAQHNPNSWQSSFPLRHVHDRETKCSKYSMIVNRISWGSATIRFMTSIECPVLPICQVLFSSVMETIKMQVLEVGLNVNAHVNVVSFSNISKKSSFYIGWLGLGKMVFLQWILNSYILANFMLPLFSLMILIICLLLLQWGKWLGSWGRIMSVKLNSVVLLYIWIYASLFTSFDLHNLQK